ncbi:hypothetical protein LT493_02680 [Streptomyces tricolor]|nr:hypothetical protein [Streptomyces tricolor]
MSAPDARAPGRRATPQVVGRVPGARWPQRGLSGLLGSGDGRVGGRHPAGAADGRRNIEARAAGDRGRSGRAGRDGPSGPSRTARRISGTTRRRGADGTAVRRGRAPVRSRVPRGFCAVCAGVRIQAARCDYGTAATHSITRRWYSARCSVVSLPPDRRHRARISSLTSAADRSGGFNRVVDMV